MKEVFQKRKQVFRNQCLKYSRYVFNDHFVLFLLVFIGFLAVQYSQLLRNFPKVIYKNKCVHLIYYGVYFKRLFYY